MQFIASWATPDRRILLNLSDSVLKDFECHIQAAPCDSEAGGLLLGTEHGANLAISEATIPTVWDKRFRYFFERMPKGHKALAYARWLASGGTVRYLGEWHTHPQDVPLPSGTDRTEWAKLASKRVDGRPLLAVIVGRQELYIELATSNGSGQVLVPLT